MTGYYEQAEQLLKPQEGRQGFMRLSSDRGSEPQGPTGTVPADKVAAQVFATLAVASELGKIAAALNELAKGQNPSER